jgi:KDO2-lipid IV(A) lauroyltransferase
LANRSEFRNRLEAAIARSVLLSLEIFYARLLDLAIPRYRRIAHRNLSFAFPHEDAAWRSRTIDGIFESIGRMLSTFAKFPGIRKENVSEWIRYEGFEHYEAALRLGKGVLFATAHLGNWELSAFAHALLAHPALQTRFRPLHSAGSPEKSGRRNPYGSEHFP